MTACAAADVKVIPVNEGGTSKVNCIQLRGKIPILVNNKPRPIGFKFILLSSYPNTAPCVYLDEPIDESVVAMIDYIDKNNRILSDLLHNWGKPYKAQVHCLGNVLTDVYRLFKSAPPIPLSEM